jgi:1-phosphatidylinositol phosphodiesterase
MKGKLLILLSIVFVFGILPLNANAYTGSDWMGSIDGNKSLAQLSIPGTHDSCARYEPFPGTAICQKLTIADQLTAGIRYLDIRCRHYYDAFAIHHGSVYQHMNFDDVLNACISFLESHPTETIIMSVKEEYNAANNTRTFEQTFDSYVAKNPDKWYMTATIPNLSQVRGKIVLLRRFGANTLPKGINAANWADNTTFTIINDSANLKIQDQYVVPDNNAKWTNIQNLYNEAKTQNSNWLYINYTSGYKSGFLGIPVITTVSNFVNPKIATYFTANKSGRFGISAMDFADANKCSLIITTNF